MAPVTSRLDLHSDMPQTKILVVDDSADARALTSLVLREAGFDVHEAANGSEALALAAREPDLVVLDIHLPDIDGYEVCRRLKADPSTASIPVLHLSAAYRNSHHRVKGLEVGADAYLTHPVEPEELLATVNALLRIRRAEAEARESQAHYRRLVDTALEGIWTIDADARTTYVNRQMAAMLGYAVDEMIGRSFYDFMSAAERAEAEANFERRRRGLRELHDVRFRRRDGSDLWAIVSAIPLAGHDGRFVGALALVTDITERKRTEDELYRLASIIDGSNDAIIGTSLDGVITSWNTAARILYGYPAGAALGRSIAMLMPADHRTTIAAILGRLGQDLRLSHLETVHADKDGRAIDVFLTVSPIKDSRGQLTGASWIARDITDRKRAERAEREALALRSVARLANAAGHEINNPLTVIVGALQLVEKRLELDEPSRRWIGRALDAAGLIQEIIRRMSRITRLENAEQASSLPEMLDIRKSSPEVDLDSGRTRLPS
jgi:two-component system, cell cycle sensor histidine kinase and response regulator CckA